MKFSVLTFLFLFSFLSFSQNNPAENDTTVYTMADQMPQFPGGMQPMMNFIQARQIYPEAEKNAKVFGTCFITFVVEKDGSITYPKLLRGVKNGPGFDQESLRLLSSMPKWVPGKQGGKEVRVQCNLPIKFILPVALNDTIYLSKDWKPALKENAEFFRIITQENYGYTVKDFYMNTNLLQMVGMASSVDPIVSEGKTTYCFASGIKSEEGYYKKDRKVGRWIIWDEDGKDSSVLNYTDQTIKYERISEKLPLRELAFDIVETMPEFPGGEAKMMKFIQANIQYPSTELKKGITGTCYIQFIVESNGSLSNFRVIKGVDKAPNLEIEALRVISMMPDWTPGKLAEKPVRVRFNLPIKYTLR